MNIKSPNHHRDGTVTGEWEGTYSGPESGRRYLQQIPGLKKNLAIKY